uniref:Putative glycoprotein n=1 Tax=Aedes anphevirus TaxID=2230910 RepID=A0A2Z4HFH2_9MONO|nr:putative glycoprotein [Aedes anphevirus]
MMERVDYKGLDYVGMLSAGLIPPPIGVLRGKKKTFKKMAALWSLACCIRSTEGLEQRAYIVRGVTLTCGAESEDFQLETMVAVVSKDVGLSEDDTYLLSDLVASGERKDAISACYRWTADSRKFDVNLPDIPITGSVMAQRWLREVSEHMASVLYPDDATTDPLSGAHLPPDKWDEDLSTRRSVSGDDERSMSSDNLEECASAESIASPAKATSKANTSLLGQDSSEDCPILREGPEIRRPTDPGEREEFQRQVIGCLGAYSASLVRQAIQEQADENQRIVQMDTDILMRMIKEEVDMINDCTRARQYLCQVYDALHDQRIPYMKNIASYREDMAMRCHVLENALWEIVTVRGNGSGVPHIWNKVHLGDMYARYYPAHAELMRSANYVADIDQVWRNVNNMVISEIKNTGNYDHKDVRDNIPLTKDEVLTAIKKAAEVPDSLKSILTAGVDKIQLIADKFVSGSRPLEKETVESLRVDRRSSVCAPLDSDPVTKSEAPVAGRSKRTPEEEAELIRAFNAKMDRM